LRTSIIDDHVAAYLTSTVSEHPVLRELRAETAKMPNAGMQIGADQAQFMQLMARIIGARNYVEIGVFTGYSSLAMALALPADGRVLACDINEEYTSVARRYWEKAGVASKITLRLAPALETLDAEIQTRAGAYDIAFIDADKTGADAYYERCFTLLRPGGVIMVDNTLWDGRVADATVNDPDTVALRDITKKAMGDSRVDAALTPIGDGILIVRKK
jgi:predicted O-methyltransferase YrrM